MYKRGSGTLQAPTPQPVRKVPDARLLRVEAQSASRHSASGHSMLPSSCACCPVGDAAPSTLLEPRAAACSAMLGMTTSSASGSKPGWLEGLTRRVKGLPWMARYLWESMTCLSKKTLSMCTRYYGLVEPGIHKAAVGRPGSGAAPLLRRGDGDAVEENPCKLCGVTDPSDRLRRGVGESMVAIGQNKLCVFPCRHVSEPDNFVFHLYTAAARTRSAAAVRVQEHTMTTLRPDTKISRGARPARA